VQICLGQAWMAAKGQGVPQVECAYPGRARYAGRWGRPRNSSRSCGGCGGFTWCGRSTRWARELAEQCLSLAQGVHDQALLLVAHYMLGGTLYHLGELTPGRAHLEQGLALYDRQQHHQSGLPFGMDLGVWCLSYVAWPSGSSAIRNRPSSGATKRSLWPGAVSPLSLAAALDYAACCITTAARGKLPRSGQRQVWHRQREGVSAVCGSGHAHARLGTGRAGPGAEGIAQIHQGLPLFGPPGRVRATA